jgi:septal ring factor EnvC (AmiA/AmiB activator)
MSEDQLRNFVRFLFEMLETAKAHLASVEKTLAEVKDELKSANSVIGSQAKGMERLNLQVVELNAQLRESNRLVIELTSLNAKFVGELTILKSDHFGTSKSRKGQGVNKRL